MVSDIVDSASNQQNTLLIKHEEFSLQAVAQSAVDTMTTLVQRGVKLLNEVPAELPLVVGDSSRIFQVLVNLISNSLRFTRVGQVKISAHRLPTAQPASVQVTVSDTGIGIPADKLDGIFGAFQQVDTSTTRKYGGTGLGLALVKTLVEAHHGTVGVESRHGGLKSGTTFHITLPERQPASSPPRSRSMSAASKDLGDRQADAMPPVIRDEDRMAVRDEARGRGSEWDGESRMAASPSRMAGHAAQHLTENGRHPQILSPCSPSAHSKVLPTDSHLLVLLPPPSNFPSPAPPPVPSFCIESSPKGDEIFSVHASHQQEGAREGMGEGDRTGSPLRPQRERLDGDEGEDRSRTPREGEGGRRGEREDSESTGRHAHWSGGAEVSEGSARRTGEGGRGGRGSGRRGGRREESAREDGGGAECIIPGSGGGGGGAGGRADVAGLVMRRAVEQAVLRQTACERRERLALHYAHHRQVATEALIRDLLNL